MLYDILQQTFQIYGCLIFLFYIHLMYIILFPKQISWWKKYSPLSCYPLGTFILLRPNLSTIMMNKMFQIYRFQNVIYLWWNTYTQDLKICFPKKPNNMSLWKGKFFLRTFLPWFTPKQNRNKYAKSPEVADARYLV